jgi:hypothetical protein
VPVADLEDAGGPPRYIAISHTWGRWKTEEPPARLPGTPWDIPANSRFDVAALPGIMERMPLSHRYVWLDLLCIPQDRSELSRSEISRQATIFREADAVVMWLNDVRGPWAALPGLVEWLCVRFVADNGFSVDPSAEEARQREVRRRLSGVMELTGLPHTGTSATSGTSSAGAAGGHNPWFTSLWTLQEICLRPAMLIANRDWEFVALGDILVTFDEIVALESSERIARATMNADEEPPPPPAAAVALRSLLTDTGLLGLVNMTRASVLALGGRRQCLERPLRPGLIVKIGVYSQDPVPLDRSSGGRRRSD